MYVFFYIYVCLYVRLCEYVNFFILENIGQKLQIHSLIIDNVSLGVAHHVPTAQLVSSNV